MVDAPSLGILRPLKQRQEPFYNIAPGPAGCLDSRHYMLLTKIFRGASVLVSFKPVRKAWYLGSGGGGALPYESRSSSRLGV